MCKFEAKVRRERGVPSWNMEHGALRGAVRCLEEEISCRGHGTDVGLRTGDGDS